MNLTLIRYRLETPNDIAAFQSQVGVFLLIFAESMLCAEGGRNVRQSAGPIFVLQP